VAAEAHQHRALGREPTDTTHPGEVPSAPPTEHGAESGLKVLVDDLHDRRGKAKLGGGAERVTRQHERGKLTARERIDLLADPGTFVELGLHGRPHFSQASMKDKEAPADGVITGWGNVDGRRCAIVAYDFTVMAGSMGMTGELKVTRLLELALQKRLPFIWLLDSAGARIQEAVGSLFAGSGFLFREEVTMSGVVPLVAALLGPCAAGTAYIPALADFVPMVVGQGAMALAGPHLTKAVTGEEISDEQLGGAMTHNIKSGVAQFACDDDKQAIEEIKKLLSYLPPSNDEKPQAITSTDSPERADPALDDIIPENPRQTYDVKDIIRLIVDNGEVLEPSRLYAPNLITCFARLSGHVVGIIASQPNHLAGCLDINASDKATRFIRFCDAFNIPLLTIADVPGYLPGSHQEWGGIIRHGAKLLWCYSEATVPKVTLITRKAYGGAYIAMCSQSLGADYTL
ncbi:hypothetical protein LCGC14_2621850, partial [marine sediment metagenome]